MFSGEGLALGLRSWNVVWSTSSLFSFHTRFNMWGWGREGKCVFKNNMLFLDFVAEGPAGCWDEPALNLEPLCSPAFLSHSICSLCLPGCLPPQGGHLVGTVPVSCLCSPCLPECDMIVSLGTVKRCQWRTEVSHASAIFFFKAKKKRLLNLGTLDLESSLPGVRGNIVPSLSISSVGQISNMGTIWLPIHQLSSDNSIKFLLALKLPYLCFSLGEILGHGNGELHPLTNFPPHFPHLYPL